MKLPVSLWMACLVIVFGSCQKAYSPDGLVLPGTGGGTTDPNAPLVVKTESRTTGSTESSTQVFEYDAARRLAKVTAVVTDSNNLSSTAVYRYVRNSVGLLTKIVSNVLMGGPSGSDSLQINIQYPAGSSSFNARTFVFQLSNGFTLKDSVTFVYTNGVVTRSTQYQDIGLGMSEAGRIEYTYTNGNLASQKIYNQNSGTMSLDGTYVFEYDNKPNMAKFGIESFLPGLDPLYACANNPAKATIVIPNLASIMLSYTYQYNSSNQPTGGSVIQAPPGKTSILTFTYQ